jgi:hypothetical protein
MFHYFILVVILLQKPVKEGRLERVHQAEYERTVYIGRVHVLRVGQIMLDVVVPQGLVQHILHSQGLQTREVHIIHVPVLEQLLLVHQHYFFLFARMPQRN